MSILACLLKRLSADGAMSSSPALGIISAGVPADDPRAGNAALSTGALRVTHALDLDRSHPTMQSGGMALRYDYGTVGVRPIVQSTVQLDGASPVPTSIVAKLQLDDDGLQGVETLTQGVDLALETLAIGTGIRRRPFHDSRSTTTSAKWPLPVNESLRGFQRSPPIRVRADLGSNCPVGVGPMGSSASGPGLASAVPPIIMSPISAERQRRHRNARDIVSPSGAWRSVEPTRIPHYRRRFNVFTSPPALAMANAAGRGSL